MQKTQIVKRMRIGKPYLSKFAVSAVLALIILPAGVRSEVKPNSWIVPPVFNWLQELGEVDDEEMKRVFNMGIGLVLVLEPNAVEEVIRLVQQAGYDCFQIGTCEEG